MNRVGEKLRRLIQRRRSAYRALFAPGPASDIVLTDLAKFCRATSTPAVVSHLTGQIDQQASFIAIGRQEVYMRIAQHLHITDADLYRIINQSGDNDQDQ